MPFKITNPSICSSCPYGRCVIYIREQSKRMKDRNTQYRMIQKAAMACSFDEWVPGFSSQVSALSPFSIFINACVKNSFIAGKYIEENIPEHFGEVEEKFFLSSGQIGKVRGDIFENIARVILWNSSLCLSSTYDGPYPEEIQKIFRMTHVTKNYAAITLGDNYDLKSLFTTSAKNEFSRFETFLERKGTSLAYSTPDIVVIELKSQPMIDKFKKPMLNLSVENQDYMASAKKYIEGKLDPSDIVMAAGIKTSIRSDRMYQLLFEANAWKAIWRTIYDLEPSKYFSLITQSYGANPQKLNSLEFISVAKEKENVQRAIDGLNTISSPVDLITWYSDSLTQD